jgi:hypothetical protein
MQLPCGAGAGVAVTLIAVVVGFAMLGNHLSASGY